MAHIVLLGDSIFDNGAYVTGGPDVIQQVRQLLPGGWKATLLAIDGSVVEDVPWQLERLPINATHLVISAGGNDAFRHIDIFQDKVNTIAKALDIMADISLAFEKRYRSMMQAILSRGIPTAVCTIYYPCFPDPIQQRQAVTGLAFFNDAILRVAFSFGVPVIDLRLICNSDADYANPIEPSVQGGEKIARAILRMMENHDFRLTLTTVFIS